MEHALEHGAETEPGWKQGFYLLVYLCVLIIGISLIPNKIWNPTTQQVVLSLGFLSVWRFGWWLIHYLRALIYGFLVYPRIRRNAESIWASGWRPERVVFMYTTFRERRDTTEAVLDSIIREVREVGVPARLFVGSGDLSDELVLEQYIAEHARDLDIEVVIIRQNQPGKRFAIGLALRAMSRNGIGGDDPVVFMDGDSVLGPGCLRKCLPLFAMNPKMQALTTDEKVVVYGPAWVRAWLEMRFTQRRMVMQSHALSNKVLTLTGRMSVFRAHNVVRLEFIRMVEADHLNDWLWGQYRFLSGDDKSTWYWLLSQRAEMGYVPDAVVETIEHIDGSGMDRMTQNLLRWSGNVLRNGKRAIALGPNCVGWFIWWCLVDQRLAMWTTLVGPVSAIGLTLLVGPAFLLAYLLWVAATRLLLSTVLWGYAGEIRMSFPFFLYANQLLNALVKVYIVFRLPQQRWANRGNQRSFNAADRAWILKQRIATGLTSFWVFLFVTAVFVQMGIVNLHVIFTRLRLAWDGIL